MKILMVRPADNLGGAEIYNINLIKGFKKYFPDDQLFFITTLPEFGQRIKIAGAKVIVLPVFSEEVGTKRGLLRFFCRLPKYLFYYLKTILILNKKEKIDLICFQATTEKIILTPIFKVLNFQVVWLEHGPFFSFQKTKIILFMYKFLSHFADKIVTVSHDSRRGVLKGGVRPDKVVCVLTGIDTDYFAPLAVRETNKIKRSLGIKEGKKVIGYFGAICREKGIGKFLQVAECLVNKQKKIKFILVGSGPMLEQIKKIVKKKKLEGNFIFLGFQDDVKRYLAIFDIFFFPTYMEGLPLTVMEAMAMGKPTVARNIGGNRELVISGKTGYLFKNESNEELEKLLVKLLDNDKKREKMGFLARKYAVDNFNLKKWAVDLHFVLADCLKK